MSHPRTCPLCRSTVRTDYCCGIDFRAPRSAWRMTGEKVRLVHVLARSRKGLDEETYRLRLAGVGVSTSLALSRDQFHALLAGLASLPDCPLWLARHRSRANAGNGSMGTRAARGNSAGARRARHDVDDGAAVSLGEPGAGVAGRSAGAVGVSIAAEAGA